MDPKYLIDTNIWVDALGGAPEALEVIYNNDDIAMSAINYMEVASGCTPSDLVMFDGMLSGDPDIAVIHTNETIIKLASAFNQNAATGKGYGHKRLPDAIIGATAAVTGRIILTRNPSDFVGYPHVRVETPYQGQWVTSVGSDGKESKTWVPGAPLPPSATASSAAA
ncbi:PIN domain-containing protein [Duganella sp.]|uniref:PIN domain-containing protein n=1 Tax=Duganella sp. TaxID=1904440 RepID=UPI0031E25AE2